MHRNVIVVAGLALAAACSGGGREDAGGSLASDTALGRDLRMATQPSAYPPMDSVSAVEATGAAAPAPVARRAASSAPRTTRSSPRRAATRDGGGEGTRGTSSTRSGGDVETRPAASAPAPPAEQVITEKHTKRDAAIGAAAGAVLGAATSRDRVKGAVIGAAAGAIIGGVIGNNVDVKKRRVPVDTTRP